MKLSATVATQSDEKQQTILIIDDDPASLKTLANYLIRYNFEISIAHTSLSGLQKAQYAQPHLILLDILLPDTDGFETCARLKANPSTKDIPVIFMTSLIETKSKIKGFAIGGVDYITKPLQLEEVLARVQTHLTLRNLHQHLLEKNVQLEQEITARQRAEAALKESEDLFYELAENFHDVIFVRDFKQNKTLYVNSAYERIWNQSRESLYQNQGLFRDIIHPEDQELVTRFREQQDQGIISSLEYRIIRSRDEHRWIWARTFPIYNEAGEVYRIVGVAADITERKQTEQALQTAHDELEQRVHERTIELIRTNALLRQEIKERKQIEEKLRQSEETAHALLNAYTDAALLIDIKGTILALNDTMAARFQKPAADIIGLNSLDVFPDHIIQQGQGTVNQLLQSKQPIRLEGKFLDQIQDNHYYPIIDTSGQVTRIAIYSHDITEQKLAEAQIKSSLHEKEVLLKEIHHRVKNNLQIITSLLYLQAKQVKNQQTFSMFQESQNRVKSMALIHEKLYQAPDLAHIDFGDYIRNLTNHLFRSYGVSSSYINLKIETNHILLNIDVAILCGLIINELVSNALKYAFPQESHPSGNICIGLQRDESGQITLTTHDNGLGFPAEVDFKHPATLGLQLVNNLVKQLNGTIELESNQETTFKICFIESSSPGTKG